MDQSTDIMHPHAPRAVVVECPACKQPGFMEAWPRITSSVDEQPTQLLLDGKLFQYECPVCSHATTIVYDCLFHDVEHQTLLFYTTSPQADTNAPPFLKSLTQNAQAERLVPYQARLIGTTFELCEKARILAAGYDDRVIELMKVGIKRGMLKEGIVGSRDILIYERTMPDGGVSFVVMGEIPGDVVGVPDGYDYCKEFLMHAEKRGDLIDQYRFDAAWANAFLP